MLKQPIHTMIQSNREHERTTTQDARRHGACVQSYAQTQFSRVLTQVLNQHINQGIHFE